MAQIGRKFQLIEVVAHIAVTPEAHTCATKLADYEVLRILYAADDSLRFLQGCCKACRIHLLVVVGKVGVRKLFVFLDAFEL